MARPGDLAAAVLALPPELEGRIFPVGDADLALATPPSSYSTGEVDGGVLRSVTSIQVPWDYTQTAKPTDTAIGTAVLVDWQAVLEDSNFVPWLGDVGPNAQTGIFGPRGVFQVEGELRYARDMGQFNLTPISYASQLAVTNADGADRTITPGWGFMNNAWFMSRDDRKLTLRYNDTARGMGGFIDNQLYAIEPGTEGTIDGSAYGYEALSFVSRTFVTPGVHLAGVVGFDMADINHPIVESSSPGPAAGEVDYTIGLRVEHLSRGGSFGIGVQNGSRTVLSPQTALVEGPASTIRTDASCIVIETDTTSGVVLTSTPTLPEGREGQLVTLVHGGAQPVTFQSEASLAGSGLAATHTLLPGDVLDLLFDGGLWVQRSATVSWQRTRSLPGVSAWQLPTFGPGVTSYQSTHASGGATGIDITTPEGETSPSGHIRLFRANETAARTVLAAGILGFSDGADAEGGTYLARIEPGVVGLGSFTGVQHTLQADLHGGQRRDVLGVTDTSYAVVADDRRRTITRSNASASTMTWPSDGAVPLPVGTEIQVCNLGSGEVSHVAGSGASVIVASAQAAGTRWVGVKVAADTWCVG